MMLDFYGMRLVDPATGQIGRSETPGLVDASWKRRYQGLLQNSHNYLRITRSKSVPTTCSRPQPFPACLSAQPVAAATFAPRH